jgi:hypothetical protein
MKAWRQGTAALLATITLTATVSADEPVPPCEGAPPTGAAPPEATRLPAGCYLDIDGRLKSPTDVYDRRLDELDPSHLITFGELLVFLGAGIVWYAADDERNLADWDFPSWEQRFTLEAWTFDNNHFPINWMGHPLSGAAYYAFPRANDHSVWVSNTYGFMTSFLWEFLVEFREKVSVNDLIATFGAGLNIGEFAHKLWRYFSGVPKDSSVAQDFLAGTLGFPVFLKRAVYGDPQYVEGPYDAYGFANRIGQHLAVGIETRLNSFGEGDDARLVSTHGMRIGGRLSSIPGEGQPGRFAMFFHEADVVEAWLSAAVGSDARQWDLLAETHLLGMYGQDIDRAGRGFTGIVSLESAYRYRFWDFDGYNDRLGIFHFPGLGAEVRYVGDGVAFGAHWRFNGDFAGIHSAAFPAWRDAVVKEGDNEKTILKKHGYYFGWGVSSRFGGQLQLGPVDVRGAASVAAYDSQEGLDRNQADINLDVEATDRVHEAEAEIGFTIPSTTFRLGVGWAATERKSRVESFSVTRDFQTWSVGLSAAL